MTTVPWRSPTETARRWTVRYALLAVVAAEVMAAALGLALWALGVEAGPGLSFLVAEGSFLLTLVPLHRRGRLTRRDLGLVTVPGARSVGLVLLGLFAYGWFGRAWQLYVHVPPAPNNFPAISEAGTTAIVLAGIAACVGAPVVEEIFFRGFLYRSLRNRLSVAPACLLAGAIFGVLHWQYPLVVRPELAFFGVVACLLYERTGSLLPGIALHSVIDASGFEYALTGRVTVVVSIFLLLAVVLVLTAAARGLARRLRSRRLRRRSRGRAATLTWYPAWPVRPAPPPAPSPAIAATSSARLPLLLACLAVAVIGLVADRGGVFAAARTERTVASPGTVGIATRRTSGCSFGEGPKLALVGESELSNLRARMSAIVSLVGGNRYEAGVPTTSDMWSDNGPSAPDATMSGAGYPAGYEIRQWAGNGDDVVGDVLEFPTESDAATFFREAVSIGCRRQATVWPAVRLPDAGHLVWENPDRYMQEDTFLVRGNLVYRFADVRRPTGSTPAAEERAAFAITDALACQVPDARCLRSGGDGTGHRRRSGVAT